MSIVRKELFHVWINDHGNKDKSLTVIKYVMSKIEVNEDNDEKYKTSKQTVTKFAHDLRKKWESANRTKKYFEAKYEKWLNGYLIFLITDTDCEVAGISASGIHI